MAWNPAAFALVGILFSVSNILFHTLWGLVDRYGHVDSHDHGGRHVTLPLFYACCPDARWPIYVNAIRRHLLAATAWRSTRIMESLPRAAHDVCGRAGRVSGFVNFAASVLSGWLADLLAGLRVELFGFTIVNYTILFLITTLLRVPALLILHRIREPEAVHTREFVRRMFIELNRRIGIGRHIFPYP